jgi:hypothetical protein
MAAITQLEPRDSCSVPRDAFRTRSVDTLSRSAEPASRSATEQSCRIAWRVACHAEHGSCGFGYHSPWAVIALAMLSLAGRCPLVPAGDTTHVAQEIPAEMDFPVPCRAIARRGLRGTARSGEGVERR